jgi:hypothetical protein
MGDMHRHELLLKEDEVQLTGKCAICNRLQVEGSQYCRYHEQSYTKLLSTYRQWKNALDLTWSQYLHEIINHKETGEWARQVAAHQYGGKRV